MAGHNTVEVNLLFKAQTEQAKNNMQSLANLLNQIATTTTIGVESGQLSQAVNAAQQLQIHLQNAVNVNTGKLNLDKLNASLKSSGANLSQMANQLLTVGPTGQQAFVKLAGAIASAEAPMMRVNAKLKAFTTTLFNTVKWQIASSAIHGVTKAFSNMLGYTKQLNTALNDIRIVSGQSTTQIANFAVKAQEAAQRLNTTATAYAQAALIFYQQGLSGDEVLERTDAVVKMANVTGQTASVVSDQLTAVWNNFDNGIQTLEYYADVMAKLGATTAASTDEIAKGLEKFAAVADTVGLSYEYAASAVATVVAETRQSADVVGTAFKTIFARMEGLKLGETLDDGTSLNQYSQALASVGVNIKDASGELKSMDQILDELGAKWQLLGKDAQVALAQSVGGLRQYNQFMALMDNWKTVELNIDVSKESIGTLTEQQKIWEDSWAGASKRVERSANALYEQMLDDDFVIGLMDGFSDFIDVIGEIVDSLGGIGNVFILLASIFSSRLMPIISNGLQTLSNNIKVFTGAAAREAAEMRAKIQADMAQMAADPNNGLSIHMKEQINISKDLGDMKQKLAEKTKVLSEAQLLELRNAVDVCEMLGQEAAKRHEVAEAAEQEYKAKIKTQNTTGAGGEAIARTVGVQQLTNAKKYNEAEIKQITNYASKNNVFGLETQISEKAKQGLEQEVKLLQEALELRKQMNQAKYEGAANLVTQKSEMTWATGETDQYGKAMRKDAVQAIGGQAELDSSTVDLKASYTNYEKVIQQQEQYGHAIEKTIGLSKDLEISQSKLNTTQDKNSQEFKEASRVYEETKQAFQKLGKSLGDFGGKQVSQEIQRIEKAFANLQDDPKALQKAMQDLKQSMDNFKSGCQNTRDGLDSVQAEFQETLQNSGAFSAGLEQTEQGLRDMARANIEASEAQDRYNQKLDENQNKLNRNKTGITAMANGLGSLASSATMAITGFSMLGTVFDSSADPMQRVTSALMAISMIMPIVAKTSEWLTKAKAGETKGWIANTAAKISNFAADKLKLLWSKLIKVAMKEEDGRVVANTTGWWANTVAKIMNAEAGKGLAGVITGAIAVALALGTMAIAADTIATQMNTEETAGNTKVKAANAKVTGELIDNWEEQSSTMDDLIAQYHDLNEAGEDLYDIQQKLSEQAPQTAQAYRDMADSLKDNALTLQNYYALLDKINAYEAAVAAGDIEKAQKLAKEIQSEQSAGIKTQSEDALQSAYNKIINSDDFASDITDTSYLQTNLDTAQNQVVFNPDYSGNSSTIKTAYEKMFEEVSTGTADETMQKVFEELLGESMVAGVNGDEVTLNLGTTPQELLASYKALQKAATRAESYGLTYEEFGKYFDQIVTAMKDAAVEAGLEEGMDEFAALVEQNEAASVQEVISSSDMDITKINSLAQYQDFRDQAVKDLIQNNPEMEQERAEKLINDYLEEQSFLTTSSAQDKLIRATGINRAEKMGYEYGTDKYKQLVEQETEKVQKIYDELIKTNPDSAEVVAKLNWNTYESKQALENELEILKGVAAAEEIDVKITAYTTAQGALKDSGMTADDWAKIKDSGIAWGEEGNVDFETFVAMTYQQQQNLLAAQIAQEYANKQQALIEAEQRFAIDKTLSEAERRALEEEIEMLREQILISGEINKEQQVNRAIDSGSWQDLQQAIDNTNMSLTETNEAYDSFIEAVAKNQGLDASQLQVLSDQVPYLADSLDNMSKSVKNNPILSGQIATRIAQTDKGLSNFAKNLADIQTGLNSENLIDYANAITLVKDSILEIIGAKDEFEQATMSLGTHFEKWVKNNLDVVIDALAGNEQAMATVIQNIATDTYQQITKVSSTVAENAMLSLQEFVTMAANGGIQFGGEITSEYQKIIEDHINYMVTVCGASVDEINAFLASIGLTATWAEGKLQDLANAKFTFIGFDFTDAVQQLDNYLDKLEKSRKSDIVERYKEINELLEDMSNALSDASKNAERLYGDNRIAQIEAINKALEQENELLNIKKNEAKNYIKQDFDELQELASEYGFTFTTGQNGQLTNYEEVMTALFNARESARKAKNVSRVEKLDEYIEDLSQVIDSYDESRETLTEVEQQIADNLNEIQDNNAEQITLRLDYALELNEDSKRLLEYQINKLGTDFAAAAEVALLKNDQSIVFENNLSSYSNALAELEANQNISDAERAEMLKKIRDGIYEELEALQGLDEEMRSYYGDTLAMAQEELDKYFGILEHNSGILEHYTSLLSLAGKSSDYKALNTVLKGVASLKKAQTQTAQNEFEIFSKQVEERKLLWQQALENGNTEAIELYKQEYEAALEAQQQAQELMLSNTEAWLEAEQELITNELQSFGQELENSLTKGLGFDYLNQAMEHASSLQEEYLTTTNKVYEINKMIAQVQKEIDNTSNSVAKRKLKEFANETEHLTKKFKLSNFELQIQKAKYDLLIAEIQLEESRNAKSTVRLQRDATGNFGYVYTADQQEIAQAQATYEEKNNALYNLGLTNANSYAQKYQQTMQESYDALTELQISYLNGEIATQEEYNRKRDELVSYYNQKLIDYSELYGIALSADSRIAQDAWSSAFIEDSDSMKNQTELWSETVDLYIQNVNSSFKTWDTTLSELKAYTNLGLLEQEVKNITSATDSLTKQIQNKVLPELDNEISKVGAVTEAWGEHLTKLTGTNGVYSAYEKILSKIADPETGLLAKLAELDKTKVTTDIVLNFTQSGTPNLSIPGDGDRDSNDDEDTNKSVTTNLSNIASIQNKEIDTKNMYVSSAHLWRADETEKTLTRTDLTLDNSKLSGLKILRTAFMGEDTGSVAYEVEYEGQKYWLQGNLMGSQDSIKADDNVSAPSDNIVSSPVKSEEVPSPKVEAPPEPSNNDIPEVGDQVWVKNDWYYTRYRRGKDDYPEGTNSRSLVKVRGTHKVMQVEDGGWMRLDIDDPGTLDGWVWKGWMDGFDTGGYTGEWGPEGKLAMLHQKELVLEPNDTSNFLAALGLLDNIIATLDNYTISAQLGGLLASPNFSMNSSGTIDQNVHIEASFPSVQDRNEIEEAMNNLINKASQYVNRKY